ncbi:homoserine dehydrogenase [Aquibacillus koreensis]|uniref:Homoserine dehydrogenase n=1 Tax=Aquibacillus koreensis TaxID=279446 RepID=A0A9X4AK90_9BACI|nr:homoserine dehydrogenase [Aquibacillus koreensis]MCT2537756.1 homoserine dehydrogenase [Aquibacillus koreensis]MDC3421210.1 homoserine dehydrogenase [Aquibacillus koreensis]
MSTNIAFIGFGGVGQALARLLKERKSSLSSNYGFESKIVAVTDVMKGSIYHPEGLDVDQLLHVVEETGKVEDYPQTPGLIRGWDSFETIKKSNADVIVEVTFTDVETGQPAIDHIRSAFENKKSVVTTNKGPVALAYNALAKLAEENGVFWGFEGTVMSGTPALRMPVTTLAGNEITEIKGILNGTTNYILTEMEKGKSYEEALEKAQSLGYAEADPTSDVEGYDARYKTAILANYLMGAPLDANEIYCEGITEMTMDKVKDSVDNDKKWKLLSRITRQEDGTVTASVQPELVDVDDPLAGVTGATNAILYECDLSGPILLTGAGAGLTETGYSLLIDIIHFHRQSALTKIEGG